MTRLLMVEDDPHDAELIARALSTMRDLDVDHVTDGAAALELLAEASAPPDLVLLDLHLPGIDGVQTLERIQAHDRSRRVPVVMLTSSTEPADLARAYDAGANAYVVKPTRLADLRAAVTDLARFWARHNRVAAGGG